MSVQVSYKKQFVLGILLILTLIIVIEISVRVYELTLPECSWLNADVFESNQVSKQVCVDMQKLEYQYLERYRWIEPNQHYPTLNTNSFGFRGPEFVKEKPPDTYRIFIIGGSTAFSVGATSDETTIAGYLQKMYDESDLKGKIQVINAGVGGAYSFEENNIIKEYLLQFEPDLIIGYDGANDARYRDIEEMPHYKKNWSFGLFTMADLTFYRTPFVLNDFIFKPYREATDYYPEYSEIVADNWKRRWLDICKLGNENGFSTIVTVQVILVTTGKQLSKDEVTYLKGNVWENTTRNILATMSGFLPEMNKSCAQTGDLRNIFDNYSEPLFFDDAHVTDRGDEIIAESLFEISYPVVKNKIQSDTNN